MVRLLSEGCLIFELERSVKPTWCNFREAFLLSLSCTGYLGILALVGLKFSEAYGAHSVPLYPWLKSEPTEGRNTPGLRCWIIGSSLSFQRKH